MCFLYIKNYHRFASGEPESLKASPAFEEQVLSLLSTPNINRNQFTQVYYVGWGCEHIKSLALETLVSCARTRCTDTNTCIFSPEQLLCQRFLAFFSLELERLSRRDFQPLNLKCYFSCGRRESI